MATYEVKSREVGRVTVSTDLMILYQSTVNPDRYELVTLLCGGAGEVRRLNPGEAFVWMQVHGIGEPPVSAPPGKLEDPFALQDS